MTIRENVYRQIRQSGSLPTLPEILFKLLEACDHAAVRPAAMAAIISMDPALSYRVLQLVNSSSGPCSPFIGIEQAVNILGSDSIRSIALNSSVEQVFVQKKWAPGLFDLQSFWWNSQLCATLARQIAVKTGFDGLDEVYLAGLLHDIGRLVLVSTFPKEHEWFLFETEDIHNELWAETRLIGITHCDAGAWLVDTWQMNSLMADALRFHHGPLEQVREAFPLIRIVYLANLLREKKSCQRNCEAGKLLMDLDRADLQEIVEGAEEEVLRNARDLHIKIGSAPSVVKGRGEETACEEDQEGEAVKDIPENLSLYEDTDSGTEAGAVLAERVKSSTVLSGILEDLVHADDSEAVIAIFERSMNILFNLTRVLFFLPDKDGHLLKGRASASSSLRHLSKGLVLPVPGSTSLIVRAYSESRLLYLTEENTRDNFADGQILAVFRCMAVCLVPLTAEKRPVGIILLGLPEAAARLTEGENRLVRMIARQVGLCLSQEDRRLRRAEEIEADRKAEVSMTARKFAHEINNPLGIIVNCLTTMGLKLSGENESQEELRIIGEEISRISSMVNHMDLFSNSAVNRFELTDINAVIEDIIHIVRTPLFTEAGMEVSFQPALDLPQIMTSGDALKQIMLNLLKNAAEAMSRGDMVEVRTALLVKNNHGRDVPDGNGLEITVEDTGPGLPDPVMKNLYKPFVTTKKNGHSGLGLSIVRKTVRDLGGSISCASIPDEGTRFSLCLPLEKNDFGLNESSQGVGILPCLGEELS